MNIRSKIEASGKMKNTNGEATCISSGDRNMFETEKKYPIFWFRDSKKTKSFFFIFDENGMPFAFGTETMLEKDEENPKLWHVIRNDIDLATFEADLDKIKKNDERLETQEEKRRKFLKDLEPTRKMVDSWPEWKRNALGPVPRMPDFPSVKSKGNTKSQS